MGDRERMNRHAKGPFDKEEGEPLKRIRGPIPEERERIGRVIDGMGCRMTPDYERPSHILQGQQEEVDHLSECLHHLEEMKRDRLERVGIPLPDPDTTLRYQEETMAAPERDVEDNWQHRGLTMLCRTCMFWVEKQPQPGMATDRRLGRCRESSPTIKGWPAVWEDDWCGAHKLDRDKI